VRWIGQRHIDVRRYNRPEQVQPILIRADAVDDGVPRRDLRVSPDHAVLIDGVLIPAKLLANGATIKREALCEAVTYYHVELETHDIVLAEALPAESYLDTGNRGMFENADAPRILHPDFDDGPRRRMAESCRPLVDDVVCGEPIWHRLAMRAGMLGFTLPWDIETTNDPRLHVVAGGRMIKPVSIEAGRYTFELPAADAPVRLVSRATRLCEAWPWAEERRRLGVAVSQMTLRRGAAIEAIPLDHPHLARGWWDVERDDAVLWRWTDGNAVIPLAAGTGPMVLEITLAGSLDYPCAEQSDVWPERAADRSSAHPAVA